MEEFRYESELVPRFLEAGQEIGYPLQEDINGGTQTGFTKSQGTLREGLRCSTSKGILEQPFRFSGIANGVRDSKSV